MTQQEQAYFTECAASVLSHKIVQEMKRYPQHGQTNALCHMVSVAWRAYSRAVDLQNRFSVQFDLRSLIRGALLHDLFLYDWHDPTSNDGLHGFRHPVRALKNAETLFKLNPKERNIIVSHMWPLTITRIPRCREAAIVCLSDKLCALYETVLKDKKLFDLDIQ